MGSSTGAPRHRVRAFLRRHWKAETLSVVTVLLLIVGVIGYYLWSLNSKLDDIERFSTDKVQNRPSPDDDRDLNILLLGSDKGKRTPARRTPRSPTTSRPRSGRSASTAATP